MDSFISYPIKFLMAHWNLFVLHRQYANNTTNKKYTQKKGKTINYQGSDCDLYFYLTVPYCDYLIILDGKLFIMWCNRCIILQQLISYQAKTEYCCI